MKKLTESRHVVPTEKEMLKDLLITQLQMLRLRLVQNIADIDKYVEQIEKRLK